MSLQKPERSYERWIVGVVGSGLLFVLMPSSAWAHPGQHHGGALETIAHLLSEPDHLALTLVAVVAGIVGARLYRRRAQARSQAKRR